jgi:signal transduction histidine kinase
MKSLRTRLTLWFALSLLLVLGLLTISGLWHLDYELRKEKWERVHPSHPDWVLHGSFTDKEVHDILGELLGFWLVIGVPAVGLALLAAFLLARYSMAPVREVNRQLALLGPTTLSQGVKVSEVDPEFRELVRHLNDLLSRLETSFTHLREYTSQVAHELRTPLQLMRLRIENEAARMDPELAEELQEELARLSNYVEMALLIARAEQGRLEIRPEEVRLKEFLEDVLEPFSRLAEAEGRRLLWSCAGGVTVHTDRGLLKQVVFNLLNNALSHGTGDIFLRGRASSRTASLLLGNCCRPKPKHNGLGIGLRLVRALAQQLPQTRVHLRQGRYFWVRVQFPVSQPAPTNQALARG